MYTGDPTTPSNPTFPLGLEMEVEMLADETANGELLPEHRPERPPRAPETPGPGYPALAEDPTAALRRRAEGPEAAEGGFELPYPIRPLEPYPRPITLPRRRVSGRYESAGTVRLELRVDVDGVKPLKKVSGDFFIQSGFTTSHVGSFRVDAPTVTVTSYEVVLRGLGTFTWSAGAPVVEVRIPRAYYFQPPADAAVGFFTPSGQAGARYACPFVSPWFRTVQIEEDRVASVTPFLQYDTSSLPSGGPARVLSVGGAFREAGIDLQAAGLRDIVSDGAIGPTWSNDELHHAMLSHFSLYRNDPQWRVWLLTAVLHDLGPGLLGIMFDQKGPHRQGAAVFHASLAGSTPERQRKQLYTCVHELGHCFNLFHSFHKQYMNPPQPNRQGSLSWMNYPQYYQPSSGAGGEGAFWNAFPFQFDDLELSHLRHGFRRDVVMGGNPFGTGAALEDPDAFAAPMEDRSGLALEVRGRTSFALGEPVVVELKLSTTTTRGRPALSHLHPNLGVVQLGIQRPDGSVVAYRPMIDHCIAAPSELLGPERPAFYESAYIGYGKDGLYFESPGTYRIRAVYQDADGSRVVSDVFTLRVRSPHSAADEDVAELLMGDEQGQLFYLRGSDSPFLDHGREALQTVLEEHAKHPMAVYPRFVEGMRTVREFKQLDAETDRVRVRPPDYETAEELLSAVVEASLAGKGVDNITLGESILRLADAQDELGEQEKAMKNAQRMLTHFRKAQVPAFVLGDLREQAESYQPETHLSLLERNERFHRPLAGLA